MKEGGAGEEAPPEQANEEKPPAEEKEAVDPKKRPEPDQDKDFVDCACCKC